MTRFLLDTHREGDVVVVVVVGEIDLATAPCVFAAASAGLEPAEVTAARLDMSQVSFVDSTGLGALVNLRDVAVHSGKSLVISKPQAGPRRVIEMMALDTLLVIEPKQ